MKRPHARAWSRHVPDARSLLPVTFLATAAPAAAWDGGRVFA